MTEPPRSHHTADESTTPMLSACQGVPIAVGLVDRARNLVEMTVNWLCMRMKRSQDIARHRPARISGRVYVQQPLFSRRRFPNYIPIDAWLQCLVVCEVNR